MGGRSVADQVAIMLDDRHPGFVDFMVKRVGQLTLYGIDEKGEPKELGKIGKPKETSTSPPAA
jgi:hypothetical protein